MAGLDPATHPRRAYPVMRTRAGPIAATVIALSLLTSSAQGNEFSSDDVAAANQVYVQYLHDHLKVVDAESRDSSRRHCALIFSGSLARLSEDLREIEALIDLSSKMQNTSDERWVLRFIGHPLGEARSESGVTLRFMEDSNPCTTDPSFAEGRSAIENATRPVVAYTDQLTRRLETAFEGHPVP
jgi:hypothetical protein